MPTQDTWDWYYEDLKGEVDEHCEEPYYGICHTCRNFDMEGHCEAPQWKISNLPMKPYNKKSCKHYDEMTQADWDWLEQLWGRT